MTDDPSPQPIDDHPEEPGAALKAARSLLVLLADTTDDALDALVVEAAAAHLNDVHPSPAPAPPADSDLCGPALRDEATAALIALVAATDDAALRARALTALVELTTPLHPGAPAAEAPSREGGKR